MPPDSTTLDDLRIDRPDDAKKHRPWWLLALAIVLVLLAALAVLRAVRPQPAAVRLLTLRAGEANGGDTVLNASGYVTARRRATVSSKVTGKVVEVLVEEGMRVERDQVMARLDTTNIGASRRLAEAQLASAESGMQETGVRIDEARLDLGRNRNLVARGISSQADLDRAQAQLDSLVARLDRERQEVEVARRQLELRRQEVEDRVIRAPFTGIVISKDAQPGEMISPVSAGGGFTRTGIATLVDMASLEIEVDVNEAYIHRVRAGQSVSATLDAYPDWPIPCHVIAIIPTADRQKATVEVRVGFDELDPRILPDMGVKVAFRGDDDGSRERPRLMIPRAALRHDGDRDIVFVAAAGRAERRAVKLGPTTGDEVPVLAGLAAGERLIIEGPADLADGDPIEETDR